MSTPPLSPEMENTSKPIASPRTYSISKLRKIPAIPFHGRAHGRGDDLSDINDDDDDDDDDAEIASGSESPDMVEASTLGLNHIRTRSTPSNLKTSNYISTPSNLGGGKGGEGDSKNRVSPISKYSAAAAPERGKTVHWSQSKSLKEPSARGLESESQHIAFAKEMQSPRFQAILRVTSGRRKRVPDIKSFSHELNSKGVRPLPLWKSRAFGRMEEIMAMVRSKFNKLKDEVNSDLGIFAGDLVGILEQSSESHPEWKESLEDLLLMARQCAKMPTSEFWLKCENIVQKLDDRRQELPMGMIKQVHTRLLFILTRCSRLLQFQKESGYEEEHILAAHQLSDLGFYAERPHGATSDFTISMGGKGSDDMHPQKFHEQNQSNQTSKQEHTIETYGTGIDATEVSTAKSVASSTGSYRMSSWKKLPSAAEKNQRVHDSTETQSKDKSQQWQHRDEVDSVENLDSPVCRAMHPEEAIKVNRVTWGVWDQHNAPYEDSLICRICEVEIPTVHVEQHSRICTIADRCDLKGLTVNERLERVAETLERILESRTPKDADTGAVSPEVSRVSTLSVPEKLHELSMSQDCLSRQSFRDMLDCGPEADCQFITDDVKNMPDISRRFSSAGSFTPQSPSTPRASQFELLLSWRRTICEYESCQQISKLLDIALSVANANNGDYSTLQYMLERLEDLKYAIQDRKVDALVIETFGRRIEKLLQEKYVTLCGLIDDVKGSSNTLVDEESSMEDDPIRSSRASPINPCSKDRTSIEDFEIIKPISRGAFGRVFLARKRATGDSFAIKVLKKADMIRKNAVESILAERDILISVRNPFVVNMLDFSTLLPVGKIFTW